MHGGTEIWYLARALNLKGYTTEVVIQRAVDRLPALPAIAGVVLHGGAGHFIAVLSENRGQVTLADPLGGESVVGLRNLAREYHFTGFSLTIRRN
jgi:hypothetical protein